MFQHMCRIEAGQDLIQKARVTMSTKKLPEDGEFVLGKTRTWAGHEIEILIRKGDDENPVLMTCVVYNPGGQLLAYRNSNRYETGFQFDEGMLNFMISVVPA